MSTHDPSSGTEPEEGGKPSFDKQPPPTGGTPAGAPSDPYGTPARPPSGDPYGTEPPPPPAGSPYDRPGSYGGTYAGAPNDQPPPGQGAGQGYTPGHADGPVPGMPPLGSWPNRILAQVIDYLLAQIVAVLLVLPFAGLGGRSGETGAFWLACLLLFVYQGIMLSRDGRTLGKRAMKVRVAMLVDGNSPTGAAAWTRAAVFVVPAVVCCAMLWWVIDGLFGVFDKPYRQCLHDKAAKTVVVSTV
ncbi:RDD family protein [Kitasatospora sp. NBC_00315]|uniref:RDD family protein n=1 Tax=Kitasatospora sp. NBC_00315 TaxID=2975963 RepID=UPI003254416B